MGYLKLENLQFSDHKYQFLLYNNIENRNTRIESIVPS